MISRVSISQQISKGGSMPKGPGTYGSKLGSPPKKKKDVNVPGESQRAYKGFVDHMISKMEGEFKKWKKSRRPHKNV